MSGLISVAEAHARLMALFAPIGTETVPLSEAAGRVLAADVVATRRPAALRRLGDGRLRRAQ